MFPLSTMHLGMYLSLSFSPCNSGRVAGAHACQVWLGFFPLCGEGAPRDWLQEKSIVGWDGGKKQPARQGTGGFSAHAWPQLWCQKVRKLGYNSFWVANERCSEALHLFVKHGLFDHAILLQGVVRHLLVVDLHGGVLPSPYRITWRVVRYQQQRRSLASAASRRALQPGQLNWDSLVFNTETP